MISARVQRLHQVVDAADIAIERGGADADEAHQVRVAAAEGAVAVALDQLLHTLVLAAPAAAVERFYRDHTFDLPALAKLTGATIVANYELASSLVATGVVDGAKAPVAMNKGGTVSPLGSGIKVHMVPAEHSSSLELSIYKPDWTGPRFLEAGAAVGFVIEFENGFKIYHTGDTDVFPGMALIGRLHKPDLALVCIGGHYTMDPEHAAFALREYLKPKHVIPMHYGTYPVINRTPAELKAALGNSPIKVIEAKPGEPLRF